MYVLCRYPWGQEAFDKAQAEEKLIFLSVGYSTCHWCHVMERESFESESIAAILNANFVSVKVDREERPDVDRVYMTFIQVRQVYFVLGICRVHDVGCSRERESVWCVYMCACMRVCVVCKVGWLCTDVDL